VEERAHRGGDCISRTGWLPIQSPVLAAGQPPGDGEARQQAETPNVTSWLEVSAAFGLYGGGWSLACSSVTSFIPAFRVTDALSDALVPRSGNVFGQKPTGNNKITSKCIGLKQAST